MICVEIFTKRDLDYLKELEEFKAIFLSHNMIAMCGKCTHEISYGCLYYISSLFFIIPFPVCFMVTTQRGMPATADVTLDW